MTIFAVLLPHPQPALAEKIQSQFGGDALRINDTQWLISASGTAQELTALLGIYDAALPTANPVGLAIIFATAGYFGRGPTNIWEWIKAKLEAPAPAPTQNAFAPAAARASG